MTFQNTVQSAEIAVIVVNYGTPDLAVEAVASVLERNHGRRRVEVHLIDNASPGNDAEIFSKTALAENWGARVTLHLEAENRGFGAGNNVVLQELSNRPMPPDKVFLLNPDARLANEVLDVLARNLDSNPQTGAVGARISNTNGAPTTAAFRFPSIMSEFTEALCFGPISRLLSRWTVPMGSDVRSGIVDWVSGAAVMFRFRALLDAGFFDEGFFLYYDEVELLHRLARHGWQCRYDTDAHIIHEEGAATNVRSGEINRVARPRYWYESRLHYSRKTWGRLGATINAGTVAIGASLNHVISFLRGRPPALPLGFLGDHWRYVCRPLLTGREPRND